MENPWQEFAGPGYELEDLGRPAVFLIPKKKLETPYEGGTVKDRIDAFLIVDFDAFTVMPLPYLGCWRNGQQHLVHDECIRYEVSFAGKERIGALVAFLAKIALAIDEDCLYFKAGEDTCLIRPRRPTEP